MCRREKLFDQALKLKRLCRFHYFSQPCDWKLEEEIDALESAFFVFWNSLNLFQKFRYRGVRILYRKFQEIKPVFRYADGKPTPPPETYSVQRIELLQRMIDALSE